jgi:hypothetical protein
VITGAGIEKLVRRLTLMAYFPAGEDIRQELADAVTEFAETDEQLDWLGRQMQIRYPQWPGIRELRACFCSKFKPKDGISVFSAVFEVAGEHLEEPPRSLAAPAMRLLKGASSPVEKEVVERPRAKDPPITDPQSKQMIADLAAAIPKMPSAAPINDGFERTLSEVLTAPADREPLSGPTPQIITREDEASAVAQYRAEKSLRESGLQSAAD